jgi:hypothetical protein
MAGGVKLKGSVPDPLGSIAFGLTGSVKIFADPDPVYSSEYYVNKLKTLSPTYGMYISSF